MVQALSAATPGVEIGIHFSISRNNDERQPRRKVAIFSPAYYFLMMSSISGGAEQPFSTRTVVPDGPGKTSLIKSVPPLCRRVAGEIYHTNAAKRLRMMALTNRGTPPLPAQVSQGQR